MKKNWAYIFSYNCIVSLLKDFAELDKLETLSSLIELSVIGNPVRFKYMPTSVQTKQCVEV